MIRKNNINAGCGIWNVGFGGSLNCSENEFVTDHNPWWGFPVGVWVNANSPDSKINLNQNQFHMQIPGFVFATGIYWDLGPFAITAPANNISIMNNSVDGQYLSLVYSFDTHGCNFQDNSRSGMNAIMADYYMYGDPDGNLKSTNNTILDNALPIATIYDETNTCPPEYCGANILLGRLQHLYHAEGNAAKAKQNELLSRMPKDIELLKKHNM